MRKGLIAALVVVLLGVLLVRLDPTDAPPEREVRRTGETATTVRPATEEPESVELPASDGDTTQQPSPTEAPPARTTAEVTAPRPLPEPKLSDAPPALHGGPEAERLDEDGSAGGPDQAMSATGGTEAGRADEATASDDAVEELAALTPKGSRPAAEQTGRQEQDDAAPSDPDAPSFDIVRVSPEGQVVIAGQARPGAQVEVLLDGEVIGEAEADAAGAFVAVLEAGASAQARQMVLRVGRPTTERVAATEPATDRSADLVVATPGEGEEPEVSFTAGAGIPSGAEPGSTEADRSEATDAGSGPPDADDPAAVAAFDPDAGSTDPAFAFSAPIIILPTVAAGEAPVVVSPGREEVEVVQPATAEAVDRLALDRITYEAGGDVVAAGRGRGESAVRTYANGQLVGEAPVAAGGGWRTTIPRRVAEEASLLRFDQVSASGSVTGRLETPFDYAGAGAVQELRQRRIVVQRGNNLWRIAEQHYGEGIRYSVIYGANAELIRDPDLIYPDQVFTIPELVESD